MTCLLEVIALTVTDARAAERGGADRVEVVSDMAADGLTPATDLVERMRAAVDIPLRVMLRDRVGFTIDRDGIACLARTAKRLRAAGADEFVLGFLTADGRIDVEATTALVEGLDGAMDLPPGHRPRRRRGGGMVGAAWLARPRFRPDGGLGRGVAHRPPGARRPGGATRGGSQTVGGRRPAGRACPGAAGDGGRRDPRWRPCAVRLGLPGTQGPGPSTPRAPR